MILGRSFTVQTTDGGSNESGLRVDVEDGLSGALLYHVPLDGVGEAGVRSLLLVVRVPRPHHARREICGRRRGGEERVVVVVVVEERSGGGE